MPAKKKIYKLPTYLAPREKNNKHKYKYISKKIFQTGGSCEVTKGMYDAAHTWIDKNPDWEYHFFDDKACRDFIKEHFPKKVLDAYDNLIPGAYKADLWRYCVLYIHGGVYVDNKCELLANSLNDVIPEDVEFLSVKEINGMTKYERANIQIAFLCAKPKHQFFKKAIDLIILHKKEEYYGYSSVFPTGPGAFGKAINLTLGRDGNYDIPAGKHVIGDCIFVILPGESMYPDKITSGEDPIINFEYKKYRQEALGNTKRNIELYYRYCWCFGGIYLDGSEQCRLNKRNNICREINLVISYCYRCSKKQARKIIIKALKKYGFTHFEIWWIVLKKIIKYEILSLFKKYY